ncbi:unnamed protein product [Brassica napus]|uniref:(rape) hypothetical protein n=1 Tax=Brassica napus TaxID=3708 RepID=A0A816L0H7_BRANA|nr:unnamed protein product [Brassica napus]
MLLSKDNFVKIRRRTKYRERERDASTSDPVHASTSGFCETQQTTPQTDFLPIREGRRKTALDLRRTPELKARRSWREVGVHVAVAEAMVGGKERIRKITRESLRRRQSSFRDVKESLTSVYSPE